MAAVSASSSLLVLQGALRRALGCILAGDQVEFQGRERGRVTCVHEDRTASVESSTAQGLAVSRRLLRDLSLVSPAPVGIPHIRVTSGEMVLLCWSGNCVLASTGHCIIDGRQQSHDSREGVHYQKRLAASEAIPDGCRVVNLSLTVDGMDQGWGNTGDSGVNLVLRSRLDNDLNDGTALLGIVFDRRQQSGRRHHLRTHCVGPGAPAPGDRLEVWLRCPNYPGWKADCTRAVVTIDFEREEHMSKLGEPSLTAINELGGFEAVDVLGLAGAYSVADEVEAASFAAAVACFNMMWKRLGDDSLLEIDLSHLSLSGLRQQGALMDPKEGNHLHQRLPPAVPRIAALLKRVERQIQHGAAILLVQRLEQNDATAGAPQNLEARSERYRQLLTSISSTLDALESHSSMLAETVLAAYAAAAKECLYRWEREIQMCHDLVCGTSTGVDAQHLEDIVLRILHTHRRRLAEAALHRAKGHDANSDMHFDSYFYSNVHFGILEQRDAMLDPNRLNYGALGAKINFDEIRADLFRQYSPRQLRSILRNDIVESKAQGAEALRAKFYDWLRAAVPEGFRPGLDMAQRQEAFLFEKCHDEAYQLLDTALNFMLCRMRVLRTDRIVDLFDEPLPDDVLCSGSRVCLHDLAAQPQLNGRCGVVRRQAASQMGTRWEVVLDGSDGSIVSVRTTNLRIVGEPQRHLQSTVSNNFAARLAYLFARRSQGILGPIVRFVRAFVGV